MDKLCSGASRSLISRPWSIRTKKISFIGRDSRQPPGMRRLRNRMEIRSLKFKFQFVSRILEQKSILCQLIPTKKRYHPSFCTLCAVFQLLRHQKNEVYDIHQFSYIFLRSQVLFGPYTCFRVKSFDESPKAKPRFTIRLIVEGTCCDVSGIWKSIAHSNSGNAGVYSVAQYGNDVYWFGRHDDDATDKFASIGYGQIDS